ncbi:MAG: hypothetical protein V3R29_09605 [Candidatus Acidoferrales bacterium]
MTADELGQTLVNLGFTRSRITAAPDSEAYIYRTPRVHLAVAVTSLARAFEPSPDDPNAAPWAIEFTLEARWLQAADIFRKNGLPVDRLAFEQYLTCLSKIGLFPSRVEDFYVFNTPEFLDLALSLNTKALAEDLTPQIVRDVVQPMVDALVQAELYLVFAATLDVQRHELRQKEEAARIHLPGQG